MKRKALTLLIEGLVLILFLFSCTSKEMKKAKEFMDAGMYEQAISLLEIEIQSNPKNAEASFLLGKCFIQTSNNRNVEEYFNRAILLDTKYKTDVSNIYFEKALEVFKSEDTRYADEYYKEAIKYNPVGSEEFATKLYEYVDEVAETSTNPSKPIQIFTTINNISPNFKIKISEKTFSIAKSFIDKGFVSEGFRYADYGITLDPTHIKDVADLYFNYGNTLLTTLNKPNDCFYYFDRSMRLNPEKKIEIGNIYFNQAKIFEKNNDISLLLLFARKAKDIIPDYNSWYQEIEQKYKPKVSNKETYNPQVTSSSLVVYFPFDGNVNDESNNRNDVSIHGNPNYVSDRFGNPSKAISFNGYDQYVVINRPNFKFDENSSFTISVWVKFERLSSASQSILFSASRASNNFIISLGTYSNNLRFGTAKQQVGWSEAKYPLSRVETNTWYNLVGVYNQGRLHFFINAKEVSNVNFEYPHTNTSYLPFSIGAGYNDKNSVYDYFKGSIDEVKVFNKALNSQEIKLLYNE
jgi:tetratricopeptide (TPR) repeat protein